MTEYNSVMRDCLSSLLLKVICIIQYYNIRHTTVSYNHSFTTILLLLSWYECNLSNNNKFKVIFSAKKIYIYKLIFLILLNNVLKKRIVRNIIMLKY